MREDTRELRISLKAIQKNYQDLCSRLSPGTRLLPVVKANMYGTDALRVCQSLSSLGASEFCVAYLDEALELRRQGILSKFLILSLSKNEIPDLVSSGFSVGVGHSETLQWIEQEAQRQGSCVCVHLQINTGMGRFGCSPSKSLEFAKSICRSPWLKLEGVMSHLSTAQSTQDDAFTLLQIERFEQIYRSLKTVDLPPFFMHLANSEGTLRFPSSHFDFVRVGIALLGIQQSPHPSLSLEPTLSLRCPIVHINELSEGESVSYGRTYRVLRKKERHAVLPIGHADGPFRSPKLSSYCLIQGQKAPFLGELCMDFSIVDITEIPSAKMGSLATLLGPDGNGNELAPQTIASQIQCSPYQVLASLGPRIKRVPIHSFL